MMIANAKKRQQLESARRPAGHVRCDAVGVCREIWERDGAGGFWRGAGPGPGVGAGPEGAVSGAVRGRGRARVGLGRK
jgi:hypothetical protein